MRGLHLYRIPVKYHKYFIAVLPQFTLLEEIRIDNYLLLPFICNLSTLRLLQIEDYCTKTKKSVDSLASLIGRNKHSLRVLGLYSLHKIGFNDWNSFLSSLTFCKNLKQLKIFHTSIPTDDVNQWYYLLNGLKSLIDLLLYQVMLYDTGFLSLCKGLFYHPTIRIFRVEYCCQTSLSCDYLIQLIPYLPNLERLIMTNLDEPDAEPIKLLKEVLYINSITFGFN